MSDETNDNIGNIKSLPNQEKDALKGNIEMFKRNMQDLIEFKVLEAQMKKKSYDAYIEAGFTPEQAMELIKGSLI